MYKACSRCGKLHPAGYRCTKGRQYKGGEERDLRSTYDWKQKRTEIKEKANYLCEVCRDKGLLTYKGLEVHHIEKLADNSDLLCDNDNLVVLCVMHHKQADAGELDKEYLRELARRRETK